MNVRAGFKLAALTGGCKRLPAAIAQWATSSTAGELSDSLPSSAVSVLVGQQVQRYLFAMTATPEIALLVSTFQRPGHLRRSLLSIAAQRAVDGLMEVVVTDDGSEDETPQVVADFARAAPFPVRMTTHPHTTFRLSRCRNEGVVASSAPYLLFLDGDCVLPRDHVRIHLDRRRPGVVMACDSVRLDEATSARVTEETIRRGGFEGWGSPEELRRLRKLDRRSRLYRLFRHPTKPKLIGNNVGIWRADFERVNGYDENFQGWGCEDDDLRLRLREAGVVIESILRWTRSLHLWHPSDPTAGGAWRDGPNVQYLLRAGRLTRCRYGLKKRSLSELAVRVIGDDLPDPLRRALAAARPSVAQNATAAGAASDHSVVSSGTRKVEKPEVEILVMAKRSAGGASDQRAAHARAKVSFSGRAELNVLVALDESPEVDDAARRAHLFVGQKRFAHLDSKRQFTLERIDEALAAVA